MPCSIQVVRRLGARLINLKCLCLSNIYGIEEGVLFGERAYWPEKVSGLALVVYKEIPKALPWLESLHMEIKLNFEGFEWPAELACLKNLGCAAPKSTIRSRAVLTD